MTLREQVEALFASGKEGWVPQYAVLDLIDAHRCIDPERLARALEDAGVSSDIFNAESDAAAIAAAYEEQE